MSTQKSFSTTKSDIFQLFLVAGRSQELIPVDAKIITNTPKMAKKLRTKGWLFDWPLTRDTTVLSLIDYSNTIQGLLSFHNSPGFTNMDLIESAPYNRSENRLYYGVGKALSALTAKISIESGNDGFVLLTPKTKLRDYYINTMGTKELGNRSQYLDAKAARRLVRIYTTGGSEQ